MSGICAEDNPHGATPQSAGAGNIADIEVNRVRAGR